MPELLSIGTTYDEFHYIIPPHTTVAHEPDSLPLYEIDHWLSQLKRNGSRSVVFVPPNREAFAWNRHREPHRTWAFNEATRAIFRRLKGNKWCVFDGELLNHQTSHISNTHYLYDLLVWNGVRMTGTTYAVRYAIMLDIWPRISTEFGHYVLDQHTWLARSYMRDFVPLFNSLSAPEDEGLVLKNPVGIYRSDKANDWMAKIRRPKPDKRRSKETS